MTDVTVLNDLATSAYSRLGKYIEVTYISNGNESKRMFSVIVKPFTMLVV